MLIVLAIIGVILAAAIPFVIRALSGTSETIVMREMQTIHQGQLQYYSMFGEFASTLTQLGPPTTGPISPAAAKLIPASLASGEKNGYIFSLTKTREGFAVHAHPKVFGRDGNRTFYIDQDGVIHQNWGEAPATVESVEVK